MPVADDIREIRALLTEQGRALGRIEGSQSAMASSLEERKDSHSNLERRVRKVEARVHWWSGAGVVIGTLAGWLGKQHVTG